MSPLVIAIDDFKVLILGGKSRASRELNSNMKNESNGILFDSDSMKVCGAEIRTTLKISCS